MSTRHISIFNSIKKKIFILLISFIPFFSGQKVFPETRFYSGLSLTYFSVSGSDFNGETYLMDGGIMFVPKIKGNFGYKLTIGGTISEKGALEFSFFRTSHNSSFVGLESNASVWIADLTLMIKFAAKKSLKPITYIGIYYSVLNSEKSAGRFSSDETINFNYDTAFSGYGFFGGGGFELFFSPRFSFRGEIILRWLIFTSAKTTYDQWATIGNGGLGGLGINFCLGIVYYF